MTRKSFTDIFPRGLIVSCQAPPGDPMDDPQVMACLARSAQDVGAVGIRANGPMNISRIRAQTGLPVIGIHKRDFEGIDVRITPTFALAHDIAKHGPQCIALDATLRPRPQGETVENLIRRIHEELGLPVLADVDTREAGLRAAELGADAVSTTLSGYTEATMPGGVVPAEPDLDLVAALANTTDVPVIAEGRHHTPEQVTEAFRLGAYTVIIGTAITRPRFIAEPFVEAVRAATGQS